MERSLLRAPVHFPFVQSSDSHWLLEVQAVPSGSPATHFLVFGSQFALSTHDCEVLEQSSPIALRATHFFCSPSQKLAFTHAELSKPEVSQVPPMSAIFVHAVVFELQ